MNKTKASIPTINKHITLIVSGGRTGTRFFGETLQKAVNDCASFHEPDVLTGELLGDLKKIRTFGLYRNFIGKLCDKTGIRALSIKHLSGRLGSDNAAKEIYKHRAKFYSEQSEKLVVESSLQWYGLLDAIPKAMPNSKVICLIRDPRAWVASAEEWGHWWASKRDWVTILGLLRLDPCILGENEACQAWDSMSPFEKLCWSWKAVNKPLIENSAKYNNMRLFRFEDLFESETRNKTMLDFLAFATQFDDHEFDFNPQALIKGEAVNTSGGMSGASWRSWDSKHCQTLQKHCGELMEQWGYGLEPEWQKKINAL